MADNAKTKTRNQIPKGEPFTRFTLDLIGDHKIVEEWTSFLKAWAEGEHLAASACGIPAKIETNVLKGTRRSLTKALRAALEHKAECLADCADNVDVHWNAEADHFQNWAEDEEIALLLDEYGK